MAVPASAIGTAGYHLRHRDQSRHLGYRDVRKRWNAGRDLSRHGLHGELALDAVSSRANELLLAGLGAGIDFLRCPHRRAVLDVLAGDLGQHVFERAQNADRVEIVVVPNVRDAEQLAFHLALSVGDDRIKAFAELLHDLAGVDPVRRADRGQRGRRR